MTLTLRAVSLNDLPLTQPITAHFDLHGGTIGRADHNTMALPDPVRHISRQQAEISAGRSGYVIKNVGSANPILVRNQPLGQGESVPLMHSDQVRIGGYLLEVIDESAGDGDAATITRGRAAADALPAPVPAPAAKRLPDDFDPFALPLPKASPAPAAASGAGAFDDLIPSAAPASIDEIFGLKSGGSYDPLAEFMAQGSPLDTAPSPPLAPPTSPDRVHQLHAAFIPPKPVVERPPVAVERPAVVEPKPAAVPTAAWNGDAAAMWTAFCEGAGIKLDPPQGPNPELMRVVGMLLRSATEGALQLMAVRSATRHELHAQVTIIRPRNNNPLKFSPDAQSALEQLLQPPLRGFLPGPAAMTDAMNDLVGHAIGTMAGTRAALEGVLGRFAPRELEAKLVGNSVLDSVLPMNRKAKLWELYLQHHQAIRDEAQEDFHTLFGKAFLAAYEQQLERLRRDKPAPAK